MAADEFDLVIIGAGSGGLTAAGFAAQIGAKVALVEKNRIGRRPYLDGLRTKQGNPQGGKSRASNAHGAPIRCNGPSARCGHDEGTRVCAPGHRTGLPVRESRRTAQAGHRSDSGRAVRFVDARTIMVGEQLFRAKWFLLTTGAHPEVPPIGGLNEVPSMTYEQIFDNDRLPNSMIIVAAGQSGCRWRTSGLLARLHVGTFRNALL